MSEPITSLPSPSLPSTADAAPYVPVSWVAAAAAVASVAFLLTLGVFGYFAFTNKKPLIEIGLLAMPAIALALCFAARRVIRNSEGTRTEMLYGVNLVNAAWWLALVLGLCYVAYLFAIDYAIHREAKGEVERWAGYLQGGGEEDVARAFHRTLAPGARQDVAPNDADRMRGRFRDEFLAFTNSDLVRLAQRNADRFKFVPGSVSWANKPGMVECSIAGTVECPEGSFPVTILLKGAEGGTGGQSVGRQWMIVRPQNGGFIDQSRATRTPYGWLVGLLEHDGGEFGKSFLQQLRGPVSHPYAYRGFVVAGGDRAGWSAVATDPKGLLQFAFAMPSNAGGDAGYADYMDKHFFKRRGGAEPPADLKARFFKSWDTLGIRPAGEKLKDPGGAPDLPMLTDATLEVRAPIEIPLAPEKPGEKIETARGRLVVACTDPALLELAKRLKESADPAQGTSDVPADLRAELMQRYRDPKNPNRLVLPWRVVRVESNLEPVIVTGPPRPGAPGGP